MAGSGGVVIFHRQNIAGESLVSAGVRRDVAKLLSAFWRFSGGVCKICLAARNAARISICRNSGRRLEMLRNFTNAAGIGRWGWRRSPEHRETSATFWRFLAAPSSDMSGPPAWRTSLRVRRDIAKILAVSAKVCQTPPNSKTPPKRRQNSAKLPPNPRQRWQPASDGARDILAMSARN